MQKRLQEAIKLMGRAGALSVDYLGQCGSKHLKFNVVACNGVKQTFFMSATPSDSRGDLNKLSKVRQFCRLNAA